MRLLRESYEASDCWWTELFGGGSALVLGRCTVFLHMSSLAKTFEIRDVVVLTVFIPVMNLVILRNWQVEVNPHSSVGHSL